MSNLVICYIRRLSEAERNNNYKRTGNKYKWVTEGIATWRHNNELITVPKGFLTDGSTCGPDHSDAWLIHDYLYRTHKIDQRPCTRREADDVMIAILNYQRCYWYARAVKLILRLNPFWVVSRSWDIGGLEGPHFYQ